MADEQKADSRSEIETYVDSLFLRAFRKSMVDFLFALLRVEGIHTEGWDPFEEIDKAIDDLNWMLEVSKENKTPETTLRVALLLYCHLVEMSAAHNILANLLRILQCQKYCSSPFLKLYYRPSKKPLVRVPPSAVKQFREIKQLTEQAGEGKLAEIVDSFFDDNVRNAFSHSDYILTKEHFRWTESGGAKQITRAALEDKLSICFHFYSRFLNRLSYWASAIPKANKPLFLIDDSTVLEIEKEADRLVGFTVHFSNGQRAWYKRTAKGVDMCNILPDRNQGLQFLCGDPRANRKGWFVRGCEIEGWDENGQANVPVA